MRRLAVLALLGLVACSGPTEAPTQTPGTPPGASATASTSTAEPTAAPASTDTSEPTQSAETDPVPETHEFTVTEHESFTQPWALAFLPDSEVMVVTERVGTMKLRYADGTVREVSGVPDVVVGGQGGLGDVVPAPSFSEDGKIYLSWVEGRTGDAGAVVGTATLDVEAAALTDLTKIWEQTPKADSRGHFSHRLAIHDGHLWVTSGDRQEMDPAQEFDNNLGKILRLTLDGQPAPDNPFAGEDSPVAHQFYSMGHRNPLGIDFDAEGRLWSSEMGPEGGDELNLIEAGGNYGWPEASNGNHYSGGEIRDHAEGDGFIAPKVFWNPSISPGSLLIYHGDLFPAWQGDAFLGALSGEALQRVDLEGENATEAENWPMGARIRAVEEGPDGAIWLLQDGDGGHLLELRPTN
ncbi:PQQ-dependent sugar dehydrogenase [Tessaracoccus rhinocerotis]|uniref:PQQ-dependent sugar dehydrogenase n=1 Tax=Tessaracoccus rhinocerotis TaxID=1689449 RepID=A0A553K692_9ACTN|nr:PQQ-dependent sugar dehydrogenase [Tessaracoccus rhinocerotis]TRY20227.1 PQQ-dependent sugar dehydrogenase [Tessaracoccus rhinocerotis]